MILLLNGEYPTIEHIIVSSKQPEGSRLTNQISKYPKLKLAITLINHIFLGVDQQINLPILLKHLIYQIRMPFLRLTLQQPEHSLDQDHVANQLIAELLSFIPFWKNEQNIAYPTFTKLSQALSFEKTSDASVLGRFDLALNIVKKIKRDQIKRSLIFEKRIVETEDSLSRKEQAHDIVERLIDVLNQEYNSPDFIKKMLQDIWSLLLNLEFVRKDDIAFFKAFKTMLSLLISCQIITTKNQLSWLDIALPKLSEELNEGFERLAIDDSTNNEFQTTLEAYHISLMSSTNQSISMDSPVTSGRQKQSDLIRLQPPSFLGASTEPVQLKSKQSKDDEKEVALGTQQNACNAILNFLQKHHAHLLKSDVQCEQVSLKEFTQLFSEPKVSERFENFGKHQKLIGKWFNFAADNKAIKLIYIEPNKGLHLFVTQDAKKSHTIEYQKFEEKIKTGEITSISNTKLFQQAVELTIHRLTNYLERKQKDSVPLITDNTSDVKPEVVKEQTRVDSLPLMHDESLNSETKVTETNKIETRTQLKPSLGVAQAIDITQLAVGSWLKIFEKGSNIKCKLAAKIVSKNIYILVDRQGKKLFELSEAELIKRYAKGEIQLLDFETVKQHVLASVISQNRSLKSENML
ncbi:MAG: DUF1631 family protein [Enterobacterales bacterium]|nr:DUF1631 family protein [Enterobacterales bacterium]